MASTTAAASNLRLGGFAAAAQGTWQAVAAGHGDTRPSQQQQKKKKEKLGGEKKSPAVRGAAAAGGKKAAAEEDVVGRCGGAISDTTVYLLLDRFAPS
ncbi:uncharacterized protein C2845_PM05G03010 [Panicum miliaceum]|uniref:Uncharacterized protein n=1 Tax=Panicum miliaceum TaxID=4540 RepID=A0A3L6T2Q9_PANMI|nr:uncharacterized protein C2845_PM05G03010 [Panicum miliaceum]